MFKKCIALLVVIVFAVSVGSAYAESAADLKKEMADLMSKNKANQDGFKKAMEDLDKTTKDRLSKLDKKDRGDRLRIKQERVTELEALRENFKKEADALSEETAKLRAKIRAASGKTAVPAATKK
jgi:polyhydroxyalkanoate synthesis regulator phasin